MTLETPVNVAQEVVIPAAKTICRPDTTLSKYLIQWVLSIQKKPHFPEAELYYLWNTIYAVMVKAEGQK